MVAMEGFTLKQEQGVSFVEISMWERHLLMALGNL